VKNPVPNPPHITTKVFL